MKASIDNEAAKFLTTGTRFWLRGANPSLSNLSSLGSLLSGPTIVMDPGPRQARAQLRRPRAGAHRPAGRPLLYEVILGSEAGSLAGGDPVTLRGFTVARYATSASPTIRRRVSCRLRPRSRSILRSFTPKA